MLLTALERHGEDHEGGLQRLRNLGRHDVWTEFVRQRRYRGDPPGGGNADAMPARAN